MSGDSFIFLAIIAREKGTAKYRKKFSTKDNEISPMIMSIALFYEENYLFFYLKSYLFSELK